MRLARTPFDLVQKGRHGGLQDEAVEMLDQLDVEHHRLLRLPENLVTEFVADYRAYAAERRVRDHRPRTFGARCQPLDA